MEEKKLLRLFVGTNFKRLRAAAYISADDQISAKIASNAELSRRRRIFRKSDLPVVRIPLIQLKKIDL